MALLRYLSSMSIAALQLGANETNFSAIVFVPLRIEKGFAVIGQIFPQNVMDVLIMFGELLEDLL